MSLPPPLDPAGARIVDRLHTGIASLIHGNQIDKSEVKNAGSRACPCHLTYEVQWRFLPDARTRRVVGNGAVSTHFGHDRRGFDAETDRRCQMGRSHQPIRQQFVDALLGDGGLSLGRSDRTKRIWDFGQHSVHDNCQHCNATGKVTCGACRGSGRETCNQCGGDGSIAQTRSVTDHNGHSRSEHYAQACSSCGASGKVTCKRCGGSRKEQCTDCQGHGFFTDICTVTVDARPSVKIAAESALSQESLIAFLLHYPVSQVVGNIDFQCTGHRSTDTDRWQVTYKASTTVVELDVGLRSKQYTAAAVGEHALPFIKPPIFDDVFIEELTDLRRIWSDNKKSFSNDRARKFFDQYTGQPVLDTAMKAVAKLKGKDRDAPQDEVLTACDGYISTGSATLLGQCMASLLDKVSPPNSLWSWTGVMALPFLLILLGSQNWVERNVQDDNPNWAVAWIYMAVIAAVLTFLASPIAAGISTIVSAIRRRAVPAEYRQHGRNWQPLKSFAWASLAFATLGTGLGLLTHYDKLPRWNNAPMQTIEEVLNLNRFMPYAQASAWLKHADFFVSSTQEPATTPSTDQRVLDIQNNLKRLGYKVSATGQMDQATIQVVALYAKKRNLKSVDQQVVLASLCKDLRGACAESSKAKRVF